ncbi:MAG: glycerophosphodiester phosphodiesterase, partial [Deltaproteobacteria bacterium]|nr:glycerophosphodiester phosphodiesterase [Deltaproteobacteria bacterium]
MGSGLAFCLTLIIAHRGARSLAPENTLAAARKALEVGADLWETDVVVTSDGELVLFHDDSLARTTNVKDRFPDRDPWHSTTFTLDEIRLLDAGSWFVKADPFGWIAAGEVTQEDLSAYRNEKIPTLREALCFTQNASFCVNLELKRLPFPMENFPVVEQVLAMIDDTGIDYKRVIISSFNHEWLREVRARNPSLAIQALAGESETDSLDWGNLEFETYNVLSTLINEKQVRALTEKGISVNLFTVNEEA